MSFLRLLVVAVFAMAVPSALGGTDLAGAPAGATAETGPLSIRVLSNRADLISGGDALVQIVMPEKATLLRQRPTVDLEVWGENQRGEVTTPGHATVLLPSREHGAVRLPDPPGGATDLQDALEAVAERFDRQ